MLEKSISSAITLFILSMISERVVTWIKLQYGSLGKKLWGFSSAYEDISKRSFNSIIDKKREKKILGLNITISILLAFLAHADIFEIINNKTGDSVIGWKNVEYKNFGDFINVSVGCLLTGFFISLGSKFWHDTLDMLLQIKNYKEKLVDDRTYKQPDNVDQILEYINTPESKLSAYGITEHGGKIAKIDGVLDVEPGYMDTAQGKKGCIEVHFSKKDTMTLVKDSYDIYLNNGFKVSIPVNKIYTGYLPKLQKVTLGSGMLIANETETNGWGSAACVVKKKNDEGIVTEERYLLSCHHVLTSEADYFQPSKNNKIKCKNKTEEEDLGIYSEGGVDDKTDAALALIANSSSIFDNSKIDSPKTIRNVTLSDVLNTTQVVIYCGKGDKRSVGTIHHNSRKKVFNYGKPWELNDIIMLTDISDGTYKPITSDGDSGSLVMDDKHNAVGLVIGVDESFTYAVKMFNIEDKYKIELI